MRVLLLLPILIPLITAILCLIAWSNRLFQRVISIAGAFGLLIAALLLLMFVWRDGIQATQIGNWPAPFGITFVSDLLSATMVVLAALIGAAVSIYSVSAVDPSRESFGYHAVFHILLMGICGSFLTGDIFDLYVWFEVMLIASFVLLVLGGEKPQIEGTIKYFTLNLMASVFLLIAAGVCYGLLGTLNMADIALQIRASNRQGLMLALAMLFIMAFGTKAAVFPLFFWLPASYHTPPSPVSAIFAGLLTKVGVYALIRVFTLMFPHLTVAREVILIIAVFTMLTGVLGAASQTEFRRILSFHIISQIGYMILGLGLVTPVALAGSIFYVIHHILVKTNLFLVSGVVNRIKGSYDLKELGGLYKSHPGLAVLFLIPALSLAGIPPLSGFWGKLILIKEGLETEHYLTSAVALLVGLLTLFSMMKIWSEAFWKAAPAGSALNIPPRFWRYGPGILLLFPIVSLAVLTLLISFLVQPVFSLSLRAAEQLTQPNEYIKAVLGSAL